MNSKKILVFDDEATIRELTVEMLEALGYKADTAATSLEAVTKCREALANSTPYDLLIFDLNIKNDKSGLETLKEIREFDTEVKAIAATGYITSEMNNGKEIEDLFDKIITKPYTFSTLSQVISDLI
jgi:CheY-like chemotaxis protein